MKFPAIDRRDPGGRPVVSDARFSDWNSAFTVVSVETSDTLSGVEKYVANER